MPGRNQGRKPSAAANSSARSHQIDHRAAMILSGQWVKEHRRRRHCSTPFNPPQPPRTLLNPSWTKARRRRAWGVRRRGVGGLQRMAEGAWPANHFDLNHRRDISHANLRLRSISMSVLAYDSVISIRS